MHCTTPLSNQGIFASLEAASTSPFGYSLCLCQLSRKRGSGEAVVKLST
jgi:hypothetical protein